MTGRREDCFLLDDINFDGQAQHDLRQNQRSWAVLGINYRKKLSYIVYVQIHKYTWFISWFIPTAHSNGFGLSVTTLSSVLLCWWIILTTYSSVSKDSVAVYNGLSPAGEERG